MEIRNKGMKIILWIVLIASILVLSRYILFKKGLTYHEQHFTKEYKRYSIKQGWKNANTKPFSTIRLYSYGHVTAREKYKNIGGNIVGFIPLGILLPLLFVRLRGLISVTSIVFFISLLFETTQLVTGLGVFDVDDLILNTAGGVAGYIIFFILKWLYGLAR